MPADDAWWRRCAAHDDDKVRIATNIRGAQNYKLKKQKSKPQTLITNSYTIDNTKSQAKTTMPTNILLQQINLLLRFSTFK